ncbi:PLASMODESMATA CALLOSE-BINDING PROTEIN 1-like [Primulina huaijiensis]|uniref:PLASMODESMATA CALLOSE-BINDING PROTEIN 1-like n=1 Tax=Primulina huaijiensis TaxID=1492673 RepID=UPI003CC77F1D
MASLNVFLSLLLLLLCFNVCKGKDWCLVSPTVGESDMKSYLDEACARLDCSAIRPGGDCYEPNLIKSHLNYALSSYYGKTGECPAIAVKTLTDPSCGKCIYP